ncbi:MAG: DUF6941 family protein, partial [Isosphaeraceae bacterium]
MSEGLAPYHLAMVICDNIHVDPATGKRTLLGTFSVIHTNTFPVAIPLMAVYVSITECRGKFTAWLQIVDVDEEREPVQRIDGEVECNDPLLILELGACPRIRVRNPQVLANKQLAS